MIDSGKVASRTAQVALASFATENRLGVMTWPRYSTRWWKKKHFLSFNFTPASSRRVSTWLTCAKCSYTVFEKITKSSMYTRQVFQRTPDRMMSKARWKVAGAFRRPKGMRL